MKKGSFKVTAIWLWLFAATLILCGVGGDINAVAQSNPFGVGIRPEASLAANQPAWIAWLIQQAAKYHGLLVSAATAVKTQPSALVTLMTAGFIYGVVHAAGPGHGKVVIASYVVATEQSAKRGIFLSVISAFLQALVAISVVGIAFVMLSATAQQVSHAALWLERASAILIGAVGLLLLIKKGTRLIKVMRPHQGDIHNASAHAHHGCDCGHHHAPDPQQLQQTLSIKQGWQAILAVGLRPCSGAILILVLTLSQGVFYAGVLSTLAMAAGTALTVASLAAFAVWGKAWITRKSEIHSKRSEIIFAVIETVAAMLVLLLGIILMLATFAMTTLKI